ncbi:MTOR-associated protein MEAK7 [Anolis sagrei]|uniref:MTOR-associated protein MEAK7 n=1 Tax=Anolis sagrei TaxID=38937 RepID=UPI003520C463
MGNVESNGSYQKHLLRFPPDEQAGIEVVFGSLSRMEVATATKALKTAEKGVTLATIKDHVKGALPESMVIRLYDGMTSVQLTEKSPGSSGRVTKEQFVVFMSAILKGNAEEKKGIVMKMISKAGGTVKGSQILGFAEDLVHSVVHFLNYRNELKGWNPKNMQNSTAGVKALASQLISELKTADGKRLEGAQALDATYDESSLEDWLFRVPQVSAFLGVIVQHGLLAGPSLLPSQGASRLLPECRGMKGAGFVSLLDLPSVAYINSCLPSELRREWRLLFSSQLHGESFSQLCGHIVHKGPCLLVLRDADGYVFGGFSSCSWEVKPQFQGNNECFLFSVSPVLGVFTQTGYNDHYMYLNHGQQTMPNGLGMGGQHEYFGLWVDSNYGKGHSKAKPRCTTYNSPQLSAKENFTFNAMEVWAVGDPPGDINVKDPKSILDADPEAHALLEMIGKSRQSEGLRVPDEDGDNNHSE